MVDVADLLIFLFLSCSATLCPAMCDRERARTGQFGFKLKQALKEKKKLTLLYTRGYAYCEVIAMLK